MKQDRMVDPTVGSPTLHQGNVVPEYERLNDPYIPVRIAPTKGVTRARRAARKQERQARKNNRKGSS